jgi:hypothetical protein
MDNNNGIEGKKDIQNVFMLAMIGLIIKLFFGQSTSSDGETGPASAAVWGFGIVLVAAVVLLFINVGLVNLVSNENAVSNTLKAVLKTGTMPIIFIIILLAWLFSMNVSNFKKINEGKVANEYLQFSFASTIMIMLELGLLLKYLLLFISPNSDGKEADLDKLKSGMSVLFVFNMVVLAVMQIILSFFSTDG